VKNNPKPLFSVVTINYNNAGGLERTIQSVIGQAEIHDIQYIVVDGNSSDDSRNIIDKYKDAIDDCIIEPDNGVYEAMNKGLMLCVSKWTIFMNSGDTFAARDVVSAMKKKGIDNPNCIAIYGDTLLHDSRLWPTKSLEELWKGMICSHQSIAIETQHLRSTKFDVNLKIAADYKLILSAYLTGRPFVRVEETPISRVEPVGISSAFLERTMERWLINKQLAISADSRGIINQYYSKLVSSGESSQLSSATNHHVDSNHIEKNIIFLISMPRSGSTLLQRIIESSQYIESTGEPWFALPILCSYDQEIIESLYDQKTLNAARSAFLNETGITDEIYHRAEASYLHSIYSEISNNTKAPYYLDKTPRYALVVDKLYQRMPNSKYIILQRNPLSVINSYCSTWAKNNLQRVAKNKFFMNDFKRGFINLINFADKHKVNPNVLVVNLEELTRDPEKVKKKLDSFLGVSVKVRDFNQHKMKNRKMGDHKTINNSNTVLNKNIDPSVAAKNFSNLKCYSDILDVIPSKVFTHYKIDVNSFLKKISSPIALEEIKKNANINTNAELSTSAQFGISVAITSFNNSATILKAIASVLNQTRPPEEIIVIDDCSTDDSVVKIKKFIDLNRSTTNIILIQNLKNKGVSTSRDIAIRKAKFKLITTLDGDDTISPLKLKAELQAIISNNAKIAFSDIKKLTSKGHQVLNTRFYHKKCQYELLTALTTRSHPVPRDMLIEKDLYISVGGFLNGFNLFEDWMLKQKLTVAAGSNGWVHSGIIGTHYDRRNPGLSNKTSMQLLYAQLKVLAINKELLTKNAIDWEPVFLNLLNLDASLSLSEFRKVTLSLKNDSQFSNYVDLKMSELYRNLGRMPANNADDKMIIDALNSLWRGQK
jgi:glycosyltransferase involved in cell wall biosynthesis